MLKQYVKSISPIYEALGTAESVLLHKIHEVNQQFCPGEYLDLADETKAMCASEDRERGGID